jgi:hypothetical protein
MERELIRQWHAPLVLGTPEVARDELRAPAEACMPAPI